MGKNILFSIILVLIMTVSSCFVYADESDDINESVMGLKVPYFEFGEGENNFVLLPGASMTSILLSEEAIENLFEPYSADYHFYVFDVPENLSEVESLEEIADSIAKILADLDVSDINLYGASMGGMIAQKIAIKYPEEVKTLSLVSTMSRSNETSEKTLDDWYGKCDGNPEELAKAIDESIYSEELLEMYADILAESEQNATKEGAARIKELIRLICDFSSYDELDRITCPVFVYAGANDKTLGVEASQEIAEKLNCYLQVYSGASHAVYDENPEFYPNLFGNIQ